MPKEILVQYCELKKEIERLEKKIDDIENNDYGSRQVSDVVQNGYKRRAVITGYDYKVNDKLQKLKVILQKRYDKLMQMQIEIEEWISSIEKSDIRQIFELRYIENMRWYQVQMEMGYNSENTARMKHDKFLEKNL